MNFRERHICSPSPVCSTTMRWWPWVSSSMFPSTWLYNATFLPPAFCNLDSSCHGRVVTGLHLCQMKSIIPLSPPLSPGGQCSGGRRKGQSVPPGQSLGWGRDNLWPQGGSSVASGGSDGPPPPPSIRGGSVSATAVWQLNNHEPESVFLIPKGLWFPWRFFKHFFIQTSFWIVKTLSSHNIHINI